MKSKRTLLVLTITVILAAAGWFFANRSPEPLPIQCGPILTRPQVLAPMAPYYVALILAPDGTVWGLGDQRARGLLGQADGEKSWRSVRRLEVGSNWVTLSCGSSYASGIKADGSLWGWSFDPLIRIGPYTNPPVQLAPGTNWKAIAAGEAHSLALRTDGTLWTWGRNEHGQVGDGTTRPSLTPKQLGTNSNWAMIAAGAFASLGIQADGTLWQWGLMSGDGGSEPKVPTRVSAGTNWTAIHTFYDCYYAKDDRGWWRWGPGSTPVISANRSIPVQCQATTNRVSVPNTRSPLLVVDQSGGIRSVRFGGSSIPAALKNVEGADPMAPISTQQDWIAAWAGFEVGFALRNDGTLWNWGFGQRFAEPSRAAMAWRSMRSWLPTWLVGAQSNTQPYVTMKPWPVVRFVTNSIPAK